MKKFTWRDIISFIDSSVTHLICKLSKALYDLLGSLS